MNAFTKTLYDWKAAYIFVVNKLKEGDLDTDKFVTSLAGRLSVNAFIDDDEPSDIGLATLFFDRAGCLRFSDIKDLAPDRNEQEELMITLMRIKLAISLVYGYDRADKCFIMWKEGEHDT